MIEVAIGTVGTVFALLAWLSSRERHPFRLGERRGDVVQLTRCRRPAVQIRTVYVFHRAHLQSADAAADATWRILPRDGSIMLDVSDIPTGESISVDYRRVWPWDRQASHRRVPGFVSKLLSRRGTKRRIQEHREQLDRKARVWRHWHGHLL